MQRIKEKYRVIYFIADVAPTDEERADAIQYGPHCRFMASRFGDVVSPETADAVAGVNIPTIYAETYPKAIPWAKWLRGEPTVAADGLPPPPGTLPPPVGNGPLSPVPAPPIVSAPVPAAQRGKEWRSNA